MQEDRKNDNKEKLILKISGMTCKSCEIKIETSIKNLTGIKSVNVSLADKNAVIYYDINKIDKQSIIENIEKSGYKAYANHFKAKKTKVNSVIQLIVITVIVIILFLLLGKTGIFNNLPEINNSMSYGLLFVMGLLTSIHCMAMCGGINLSQSINIRNIEDPAFVTFKKFIPGVLYNSGRIISYTMIGGIAGAIGSIINLNGKTQGIIVIIAGFFMIIMGINLLGIFPIMEKVTPRMPKFLANPIYKLKAGNKGPFIIGLLNGLMPCGPLQSMQLYALSTGSFISGAFSMFLFSAGTLPLMIGFSAISSLLSQKFSMKMVKVSSFLIIFLGISMLGRGFSLSGINILKSVNTKNANISMIKSGIQYVESKITSSSYEPIIVQKNIPLKWIIKSDSSSLNGCNNPITIPQYNISRKLIPGNNLIEFVPDRSGIITFTCWMGMISSTIKIVEDINNISKIEISELSNDQKKNTSSCCSQDQRNVQTGKIFIPDEYFTGSNYKPGESYIKDGVQYIFTEVTDNGYDPNIIIIQKGIKTKWTIFDKSQNEYNNRLLIPIYNVWIELKNDENLIEFIPEIDFGFDSRQNDFHGYMAIVNDINNYDDEEIKNKIENYQPIGISNR